MINYLKTPNGYYYKINNKGEKKRISEYEYKKNKKINGGLRYGEQITVDDIAYEDDYICVLKNNVKKGVLLYTCLDNSGKSQIINPVSNLGISFLAPSDSPDSINYTSIDQEIGCLFYTNQNTIKGFFSLPNSVGYFIRVDPDKTYVVNDLLNTRLFNVPRTIRDAIFLNSRKTLTQYLEINQRNKEILDKNAGNHNVTIGFDQNTWEAHIFQFPNVIPATTHYNINPNNHIIALSNINELHQTIIIHSVKYIEYNQQPHVEYHDQPYTDE
jgi:hypothetical protein